jgi:DeoR/GlpR family transcriptional regulator of sugar metabolism
VDRTLRVVTNSIDAVATLADAPSVALFSVGGSYRKDAGSFIGPLAVAALERMHIGTAFLGTSGFSPEGVFSSQNTIESELKQQVIRRAGRTVILADRAKFGRTAFSVFARAEDVDLVVTDVAPGEEPALDALSVELLYARGAEPAESTSQGGRR